MNFKVSMLQDNINGSDLLWQEIWSEIPLLGVLKKSICKFLKIWKCAMTEPVAMLKSELSAIVGTKLLMYNMSSSQKFIRKC